MRTAAGFVVTDSGWWLATAGRPGGTVLLLVEENDRESEPRAPIVIKLSIVEARELAEILGSAAERARLRLVEGARK